MDAKITLITPPDIFENYNRSILFININDTDQDAVSKWLATQNFTDDINFYVFNNEPNIDWLFWASGVVKHKYIDIDSSNNITRALAGYILGKSNTFYKTSDENLAAVYGFINNNRIKNIETFLERSFSE